MNNRIGYTSENLKAVVDKFYQMPRFLDSPEFSELSIHAKMLYVYLLDRLKLSLSSNWFDEENGQVYMYYKREEMRKVLKLTAKTVKKVVDELKSHGLMSEKVQGINLPNRIFLYAPLEEHAAGEVFPSRTGNNSTSGYGNFPTPEGEIFPPIKNEKNNNEFTENEGSKKTTTPAPEAAAADPPEATPFTEIMRFYNEICHGLRPIMSINGTRRSQVSARFSEYGTEGITTLFEKTAQSNFLQGGGERGWKADFDWLIDANNFQKVVEGKYDNDNHGVIPLPLPTTEGFIFAPAPNGVINARAAPHQNYRNKNGINTMAVLQQMLEAEEFPQTFQRKDVAV